MGEEYIELLDDNKKAAGIVIPRSKAKDLPDGHHILVSALLVKNSDNRIMMQLTSKSKDSVLSLPSGWVLHGENSRDTIVREIFEEQGLLIDKNEIILVEERLANRIAFFDIYYLKADYKREDMILQTEEVEDVVWMSPEEVFSAFEEGKVRKSSVDSIRNFLNSSFNVE